MRWTHFFPALVAVAMSVIGSRFTAEGLSGWYGTLNLPSWTPPGSFIGLVWTTIFLLFAIGGALFLRRAGKSRSASTGLGLMLMNAILNVSWSWAFFSRHDVLLAFVILLALEASVLSLIATYRRSSGLAALALAPYAAWVAFAGYLNWQVYLMNR